MLPKAANRLTQQRSNSNRMSSNATFTILAFNTSDGTVNGVRKGSYISWVVQSIFMLQKIEFVSVLSLQPSTRSPPGWNPADQRRAAARAILELAPDVVCLQVSVKFNKGNSAHCQVSCFTSCSQEVDPARSFTQLGTKYEVESTLAYICVIAF
jgi:hypothetical protein